MRRLHILLASTSLALGLAGCAPEVPQHGHALPPLRAPYYSYPTGSTPSGTEVLGPIRQLSNDVTLPLATVVGQTPITLGSAPDPVSASFALTWPGLVPDNFKTTADGTDDAPSIQRAINAACGSVVRTIRFLGHHYKINSAITQTCYANWTGEAWEEQPSGGVSQAAGTWFDVGSALIGKSSAVILFTGGTGSTVSNLAFDEPGMPAAPTPVLNSNGQTTGWSPSTWTSANYPQLMQSSGVPGMSYRHIMLDGVNAGIVATNSGRTGFFDIRGQAFAYLLNIQSAYDSSHIVYVHNWPYWSSADPVMNYEQSNESAIVSFRNDTPMWDQIFIFGAKAGIEFANEAAGSTTGVAAGSISCDFTKSCLLFDSGVNATAQIGNLRSYAQVWNTVYGAPVTMIPGSSVIEYDGYGVVQLGQMEDFGSDAAMISVVGSSGQTNTQIGSLYAVLTRMSANSSIVKFSTTATGSSVVNISMQPALTPDAPSGFTNTNAGANGSGKGQLSFPTPTAQN